MDLLATERDFGCMFEEHIPKELLSLGSFLMTINIG